MDYINDPENYMKEIAMRAQYKRSLMGAAGGTGNIPQSVPNDNLYTMDTMDYEDTSMDGSMDEMNEELTQVNDIDKDNQQFEATINKPTDDIESEVNEVQEPTISKKNIPSKLKSLFMKNRVKPKINIDKDRSPDIESSTKKSVIKVIAKTIRKYIWNRFMDYAESIDGPYEVSEDKFNNSVRNWYWSVGFRDIEINRNKITIYVDRPNKFIGKSNKDDGSTFLTDLQGIFSTLGFSMDIQKAESNEIYRYFFSDD